VTVRALRQPGEAKPFLKWAGGKRQLLSELMRHVPASYGTYYEPFVGGGALFFHLAPAKAVLADGNERLVRTYRGVRDGVERVIKLLGKFPHDKPTFERMREMDVDSGSDAEVAAWLIYLNHTGYNGLYRVNSKNRFNVPFGDYAKPKICNPALLRDCAEALDEVDLRCEDFTIVASRAKAGDFVYFDPPYVPLSGSSSFTSYTKGGFGEPEQRALADLARRLKKKGVHVVLSNSAAPLVRELYGEGFTLHEVKAARSVNATASGRGKITELIIT
jgi:DNA adenine methylase